MNINFTIVVQIINFFIAFILLKYLLFKPAVKYLQAEDKKEQGITAKISNQDNLLEQEIEKKHENWQEYQKQFQKNCPQPITKTIHTLKDKREEPEIAEISDKEIEHLTEHAQKALVERIEHVRE